MRAMLRYRPPLVSVLAIPLTLTLTLTLTFTLTLTLTLILTLNLTRYEDGWIEIIELQEGVLEMLHPDYISFPFDTQGGR